MEASLPSRTSLPARGWTIWFAQQMPLSQSTEGRADAPHMAQLLSSGAGSHAAPCRPQRPNPGGHTCLSLVTLRACSLCMNSDSAEQMGAKICALPHTLQCLEGQAWSWAAL